MQILVEHDKTTFWNMALWKYASYKITFYALFLKDVWAVPVQSLWKQELILWGKKESYMGNVHVLRERLSKGFLSLKSFVINSLLLFGKLILTFKGQFVLGVKWNSEVLILFRSAGILFTGGFYYYY